ncbi:hypothetical protein MRS44_007330 [Fusarium solani]|uniref:uncharacterized protein n=1 Tax=Fusarium solani TaxID=169388 RepID=UPI0032C42B0E|nr:hypothetical protein MRS44_007330 [Fusarium solani]
MEEKRRGGEGKSRPLVGQSHEKAGLFSSPGAARKQKATKGDIDRIRVGDGGMEMGAWDPIEEPPVPSRESTHTHYFASLRASKRPSMEASKQASKKASKQSTDSPLAPASTTHIRDALHALRPRPRPCSLAHARPPAIPRPEMHGFIKLPLQTQTQTHIQRPTRQTRRSVGSQ